MSEGGIDLEFVVPDDHALTISSAELARLPVVPGQRVRVHIERAPVARRDLLGGFAKPGQARLTIEDFDRISAEIWAGNDFGHG